MKKVTVLMATYNGEKYLDEQIQSIYDQTGVDVFLYVRDDRSTDKTCEILEKWCEKTKGDSHFSMRYYVGDKGAGAAGSFMDLINTVPTDTEYYALSDQDDKWLPVKLRIGIEKVDELKKIAGNELPLLYNSNTKRVGENLEETDNPFKKKYHTEKFGAALMQTAAGGLTFVFNLSLLKAVRKYMPNEMPMHDRWIYLVCTALGGYAYYDENAYVLYRQHGGNVMGGSNHMKLKGVELFKFRLKKLFTYDDSPKLIAKELINGYGDSIPKQNMKLLQSVSKGERFLNRIRILFNRKLKTGYFVIDVKMALQTISGKL